MVDCGCFLKNKTSEFVDKRVLACVPVDNMTPLHHGFAPSNYDVICGKGKAWYNHIGNARFRVTVQIYLTKYAAASSKHERSRMITKIVDQVRENSPVGGFVKRSAKNGRWYRVGDSMAREKVGQALRDALKKNKWSKHPNPDLDLSQNDIDKRTKQASACDEDIIMTFTAMADGFASLKEGIEVNDDVFGTDSIKASAIPPELALLNNVSNPYHHATKGTKKKIRRSANLQGTFDCHIKRTTVAYPDLVLSDNSIEIKKNEPFGNDGYIRKMTSKTPALFINGIKNDDAFDVDSFLDIRTILSTSFEMALLKKNVSNPAA